MHLSNRFLFHRHKDFIKKYPKGRMSKEAFIELFNRGGDFEDLADLIFSLFDQDHNGTIDFREFIITINMISPRKKGPERLKGKLLQ
jgi:Ca2+-binding EF-hand superfamily protein